MNSTHLWLRDETKPFESRTPLVPRDAKKLIQHGYQITVERSSSRVFLDSEYESAGCRLVPSGSWQQAPTDAVILGLKELPEADFALQHTHIYFAHVYKYQQGWKKTLGRFQSGRGLLLDLEYLTDAQGKRVAAFGKWAGFAGAAVGLLAWCHSRLKPQTSAQTSSGLPALKAYPNRENLIGHVRALVEEVARTSGERPRTIVIGAQGRCGQGALELLSAVGLTATAWDQEETRAGGPFREILDYDLFINNVLVRTQVPPFITQRLIDEPRRLSIIADVSCDPNGPYNPVPIYNRITTFDAPTLRIAHHPPLDVIAIDHLPSLLPRESSESFSSDLLPHLLDFKTGSGVWERARETFIRKMREMTPPSSFPTVHWVGAGLSSRSGIRKLAASGRPLVLWNRTVENAARALEGVLGSEVRIQKYEGSESLRSQVRSGDIVVSMLPAPMHPELARLCLETGAHLVTTSYISPEMKNLDESARSRGICLVNEVGLDPGIDHVFAHRLVAEYRASAEFSPENTLYFRSYCGGFPKIPNAFRYQFSWSPAAVLRALKSPARWLESGTEQTIAHPWKAVKPYVILGESFEVYPNRDSTPYLQEYGLDPSWKVAEFVRGTIRLQGWSDAWKFVFSQLENATPQDIEAISRELWAQYAYQPGEQDRVVLDVGLEAKRDGKTVWSRAYALDECGNSDDSAMGRLVSLPATFAIESLLQGQTPAGVQGVPHDPVGTELWLHKLQQAGIPVASRAL